MEIVWYYSTPSEWALNTWIVDFLKIITIYLLLSVLDTRSEFLERTLLTFRSKLLIFTHAKSGLVYFSFKTYSRNLNQYFQNIKLYLSNITCT